MYTTKGPTLLRRIAAIGALPTDDEDERLRKATLVLSTVLICSFTPLWVGTYLALGLLLPASIPLSYEVVSLTSLALFAKTKRYGWYARIQVTLMLLLPFLLQWSLGGFLPSSGVSLFALASPLGALMLIGARKATPWFVVYLILLGVSIGLEPILQPVAIPEPIRLAFFAANVSGVSLTAYLLLQYFVRERDLEHARSERLLLNVLPAPISARLKRGEGVIADRFPEATVLFADIEGFTPKSAQLQPESVVELLDDMFTEFDRLVEEHSLEKIKTIGDAYMVAGGIPVPRADHCEAVADLAIEMLAESHRRPDGLRLRIGFDSGPVVAGVIGRRRLIYDLWGDTVNTASRMESQGVPGAIQVTSRVHDLLCDRYAFEPRGRIEVKGKGPMSTWLLLRRLESPQPRQTGQRSRPCG